MSITQEQIQATVAEAMPNILAGVRREIEERAISASREAVQREVSAAVTEWVKENVVPEILSTLKEDKAGLVAIGQKIANELTDALATSMRDTVTKKLESSWERKKIFEALIG